MDATNHLLRSPRRVTLDHPQRLRQDLVPSRVMSAGRKKLPRANLPDSIAHLHPLQRQRAIELRQQQPPPPPPVSHPHVQASLATFTSCTVPASCRARSRFLNLRDSVKKSPTKSKAKVVGSSLAAGRPEIPWVPFAFAQVLPIGDDLHLFARVQRSPTRPRARSKEM